MSVDWEGVAEMGIEFATVAMVAVHGALGKLEDAVFADLQSQTQLGNCRGWHHFVIEVG